MICFACGRSERHRYADLFIDDGWRCLSEMIWYCPHCAKVEQNKLFGKELSAMRLIRRLSRMYNHAASVGYTEVDSDENES